MDFNVYTVLMIIAVLVVMFFLISKTSNYREKEKSRKLVQEFDDFVIKNNFYVDSQQTLNNNMIGIDRLNRKVIFIENTTNPPETHVIDLNDLDNCQMVKQRNPKNGHISDISLKFVFKDKSNPAVVLPVYNEVNDHIYKMMRLSKKASYWEKRISIFKDTPSPTKKREGIL